jgi:hypothetical protein
MEWLVFLLRRECARSLKIVAVTLDVVLGNFRSYEDFSERHLAEARMMVEAINFPLSLVGPLAIGGKEIGTT